jgi:hypothetical protein
LLVTALLTAGSALVAWGSVTTRLSASELLISECRLRQEKDMAEMRAKFDKIYDMLLEMNKE